MMRKTGLTAALAGAAALVAAGAVTAYAAPAEAAASTPACASSQLTVWMGIPGDGTAGSTYQQVELSNISKSSCELTGFPGISATGQNGVQLGSPASWDHSQTAKTVTLAPGATSHVVLRIVDVYNFPSSECGPVQADAVKVYPPNQTSAAEIPFSFEACSKTGPIFLTAGPVTAGTGIPGYTA